MDYQVQGRIKVIFDTQTFDSGFTKREFVVTTQEQYPQDIKLELIKERTALVDSFNVGDMVNVSFNLRGNEYNERYYVNLQAWRLQPAGQEAPQGTAPTPPNPPAPVNSLMPDSGEGDDDLPF